MGLWLQASDYKHIIIMTNGSVGPLLTADVVLYFEEHPEKIQLIQWISPEGQSPLLLIEWFSEFAQLESLDVILSNGVPPPSLSPQVNDEPSSSGLEDVNRASSSLVAMKPSDFLKPKRAQSRWREWLALIGLGLLGFAILIAGLKSMKPYRSLFRKESTLQAKLLHATPDALRAYQLLLEGKILRDGKKYSSALLLMQKDKSLYPEGYLPSIELSAALALTHIPAAELDAKQEWKQFLATLPMETRQKGIAVLGYELSRLLEARKSSASEKSKPKSKKNLQSLDEAVISLERVTRIVPGSEPANRAVHSLFLARAISLSLLTIIENPQQSSKIKDLKQILQKVPDLYVYLAPTDRALVSSLLSQTNQRVYDSGKSQDWSTFLQELWQAHQSTGYLCQMNQTGAAPDVVLYALTQASRYKQKIPELPGLFEECFVGLQSFSKIDARSVISDSTSTLDYVSVGPIDSLIKNNFRKQFPTLSPALRRLSGVKSPAGDWLLALHFNDLLGGRLLGGMRPPTKDKLCGKALYNEQICRQALWAEMRGHWRDAVQILPTFQDDVRSTELASLMERFVLDAAKEILIGQSRQKTKEISDVFKQLKEHGVTEYPELQFVLDYVRTFEGES